MKRVAPALRLGVAAAFTALALLPISTWIPGGYSAPFYPSLLGEWWSGTLIAVGGGVVLAVASRRMDGLWHPGAWTGATDGAGLLVPRRSALVALAATALYVAVSWLVFSARPLLIDEIIQVWQARVYASGHLWVPSPGYPDLYGAMHLVDHAGRVFGQFPAGGPAMLALGSLLHAEWLVGPVFAGLGVLAWAAFLRRLEEPDTPGTNALLLFAFAPFAVFMSASHMNHVTSLAWIVMGMAALAAVTGSERPRPWVALAAGLAFGLAGSIRPVDALAFGGPAGLWLFVRAVRDRRRAAECVLTAIGMAIPLGVTLWVNTQTTGHALLFGYTQLWGAGHELGFHASPWGPPHTPARGIELVNLYLLHLGSYFLETPFPALLPALAVFAFGRAWRPLERYLVTSSALLVGLYWAYWHNGNFLGPRIFYPLLPILALWTARFGALLRDKWGTDGLAIRVWVYTAAVGALIALMINIPIRAKQYGHAFLSLRWPAGDVAVTEDVQNALVLVRESWGAQTLARMWGLGVPRSEADFIYQRTDMCVMEQELEQLERAGAAGPAATTALLALTGDSARLVDSVLSTDHTEPMLPGTVYDRTCQARLRDDTQGFTLYPPLLLDDESGNVYVRDLHARDTLALLAHPGRPIYLLVPADTTLGGLPQFVPVRRDSLLADWGLPPGWHVER